MKSIKYSWKGNLSVYHIIFLAFSEEQRSPQLHYGVEATTQWRSSWVCAAIWCRGIFAAASMSSHLQHDTERNFLVPYSDVCMLILLPKYLLYSCGTCSISSYLRECITILRYKYISALWYILSIQFSFYETFY